MFCLWSSRENAIVKYYPEIKLQPYGDYCSVPIFIVFSCISFALVFFAHRNLIRETCLPYFLIIIYAVSITPSLQIPYIIDDMDHLFLLAQSMERSTLLRWMFTPHNEHVIPFLKLMYYLFYKNFWLLPQPFHLVIITICIGILCLSYHLLEKLTNSKYAAFGGITLLASTNLPDLAIFVITNSHIIFCLFFLLLLFYAQYQFCAQRKNRWLMIIVLSTVLAPATFALGAASIVFAFLFQWLCIPDKFKKSGLNTMPFVSAGWVISLIPYIAAYNQIVHTEHYHHVGSSSAFQAMDIGGGTIMLARYFYYDLIPGLLPSLYLSMGIFFFALYQGLRHKKYVNWHQIIFFGAGAIAFNFIIYAFRAAWGAHSISVSRYDVFPGFMVSMIYVLLLQPFLREKEIALRKPAIAAIFYTCAFVLVSYSGALRYHRAERVVDETYATIQQFNIDFREATENYFHDHPGISGLTLKDNIIHVNHLVSLVTKRGFAPYPSRYPRPLSFYNQYVPPKHIRKQITFGAKTDQMFLDYINDIRWKDRFAVFLTLLQ